LLLQHHKHRDFALAFLQRAERLADDRAHGFGRIERFLRVAFLVFFVALRLPIIGALGLRTQLAVGFTNYSADAGMVSGLRKVNFGDGDVQKSIEKIT